MSAHLTPPIGPRDHTQGPVDAPVQLVEYGDYECPYCGMAYPVVKAIQRRLGDQLLFAFRHFPLAEIHPHAETAAEMAEAAGARGRFWEMHDMLYRNQDALEVPQLIAYAAQLGIDPQWAASALRSHAFANRVHEDFISGVRSGVNGTPTFFINGERHDDSWDEATLLQALTNALYAGAGGRR
jgi:protein-disulfide isomerase